MKRTGDFHNFGQRVEEKGEQNPVFKKPRTVFWEHLFFGRQSPLAPVFRNLKFEKFNFASTFFRLDIHSTDGWQTGEVKKVFEKLEKDEAPEDFYRKFGALIGYAAAMGLQDLHQENVLIDQQGPIPVDVEIAFSKIILPNETHLLSRQPELTTPLSQAQAKWPLTTEDFFALLDGYTQTTAYVIDHLDELKAAIDSAIETCKFPPSIRVLLRPTQFYRDWLAGQNRETPLDKEELVQLARGDVPYFFKAPGDKSVCYFVRPNEAGIAAVPGDKYGARTEEVLNERKLRSEILPLGCLFLARHWLGAEWRGTWKNATVEITASDDIAVGIQGKVFRSAR